MSAWFPRTRANPDAALRLFCFAHAGGGASGFFRWSAHLPASMEVVACHLPGRQERLREPAIERMDTLLDALMPELTPLLDRPFAFFGHSLGAWIAFGAARRLLQSGGPQPRRLLASGCRAPHLPSHLPPLHGLPPPQLLATLQHRYGAFPNLILDDPDTLDMYLNVLRSDFALFETASFEIEPRLAAPISVFGGEADDVVTAPDLAAWALHTTAAGFDLRLFEGGHHYLKDLPPELFRAITAALDGGW